MSYDFHDLVGNAGVLLILVTFFLVQVRKMDATGIRYLVANGLGAGLILYSLLFDFNLSAFVIESVWLLISLIGLGRIFLERQVR